jgi:hypothetical protein
LPRHIDNRLFSPGIHAIADRGSQVSPLSANAGNEQAHFRADGADFLQLFGISSPDHQADVVMNIPFSGFASHCFIQRQAIYMKVLKIPGSFVRGPAEDEYPFVLVADKRLYGIEAEVGTNGGGIEAVNREERPGIRPGRIAYIAALGISRLREYQRVYPQRSSPE